MGFSGLQQITGCLQALSFQRDVSVLYFEYLTVSVLCRRVFRDPPSAAADSRERVGALYCVFDCVGAVSAA
jgi:hypothetical protein